MHRRAGRGARLERHRFALGEREDAIFAEPSGELGTPAAGPILARRHERDSPRVLRDERGPRERSRTGVRVCHRDAPAIVKTRCELAVRLASLGKSENATEAGGRYVDRANH